MNFHFVYVIHNREKNFLYIGYTKNLHERFNRHNKGEVTSTKHYVPFDLIFFEGYKSQVDALRREKYLKTTKGKTTLMTMLKDYFNEQNNPSSTKL